MPMQAENAEVERESYLTRRRAFMSLPLEERRKCLAAQAKRMAGHYERELEEITREAWQGGDIGEL